MARSINIFLKRKSSSTGKTYGRTKIKDGKGKTLSDEEVTALIISTALSLNINWRYKYG